MKEIQVASIGREATVALIAVLSAQLARCGIPISHAHIGTDQHHLSPSITLPDGTTLHIQVDSFTHQEKMATRERNDVRNARKHGMTPQVLRRRRFTGTRPIR